MARLFFALFMAAWLMSNLLLWLSEVHDLVSGVQLLVLSAPPTIVLSLFLIFSPKLEH